LFAGAFDLDNFLAIALACIVVGAIIWDLRADIRRLISGRNVVLLGILVWFLLEPMMLPVALTERYSQEEYNFGLVCVSLALGSFLATYHSSRPKVLNEFANKLCGCADSGLEWKLFLIALFIGLAPMIYFGNFNPLVLLEDVGVFGMRWGGTLARDRYGGIRDAILELQMFLKAALPLAIAIAISTRNSLPRRALASVFVLWMLARALSSATRSDLIQTGLPILGGVYYVLAPHWQRRAILTVPILMLFGYYWSSAVVVSRTSGNFDWEAADRAKYAGNEMFRELLFLTTHVPDQVSYLWGLTYYTQLVNPIPRFLWPGKPVGDAGLLLAIAGGEVNRRSGEAYLTRSPGLIGEMYWNFGIFGIVCLSAFGGYIVRGWDNMREQAYSTPFAFFVYCAGLAILFLFGRSFNLHTMYGVLSLAILLFIAAPSRKKAQDNG
jgi:oligosaccharide repeat unit polymerase